MLQSRTPHLGLGGGGELTAPHPTGLQGQCGMVKPLEGRPKTSELQVRRGNTAHLLISCPVWSAMKTLSVTSAFL